MFSQQRLDTMLHQRPSQRPTLNPKAWWKYAIACVITRPHTRPWMDVVRIVRSRSLYIQLVTKKLMKAGDVNGFHGGLSERESLQLLALEDLLPIEALLSFHLLALRKVLAMQLSGPANEDRSRRGRERSASSSSRSPGRRRSKSSLSRIRRVLGGGGSKAWRGTDDGMGEKLLAPLSWHDEDDSSDDSMFCSKPESSRPTKETQTDSDPLQVSFKVPDASACVKLIDVSNRSPILRIDVKTKGAARILGPGRSDIVLDVKQFEIFDCLDPIVANSPVQSSASSKIMTVGAPVNYADECDYFNQKENSPKVNGEGRGIGDENARSGRALNPRWRSSGGILLSNIFTPLISGKENSSSGKHAHPLLDEFSVDNSSMACLPPGVVCRVYATADRMALGLSILAHPATFVWNKPCLDAVADFFASPAPEMQSVLRGQLRNAATPLAHRAQLALMSPTSVSVHVNVNAPKLWIPVSSQSTDGALFLDAGRIKMVVSKPERITDTNWEIDASDIQVTFVRGVPGLFRSSKELESAPSKVAPALNNREEIPVIRPFQVRVTASILGEKELVGESVGTSLLESSGISQGNGLDAGQSGPHSKVSAVIGEICLNLVDVEVLAQAIGKWYAAEIVRVRHRASGMQERHDSALQTAKLSSTGVTKKVQIEEGQESDLKSGSPYEVSVVVEKVEMALEGYSELSERRKRTYLVEVFEINVKHMKQTDKAISRFTVSDASVIQMKDVSSFSVSERCYVPSPEPQHQIIVRASQIAPVLDAPLPGMKILTPPQTPQPSPVTSPNIEPVNSSVFSEIGLTPAAKSFILNASHLHDRGNHLDEVEIDVDSLVVRVTPISLRDCAQGLRRVLELMQLMTKEMERKVHEEGRLARKRDSKMRNLHKRKISDKNSNVAGTSPVARRLITPIREDSRSQDDVLTDSSILFKVTLKESTFLAGRPALSMETKSAAKNYRDRRKLESRATDAIVQVLSNVLIMFQSVENPDASGTKTLHISIDNLSSSINTKFDPVAVSDVPPMIGPTSAEFRVVMTTENQGCVVSQDVSLDCDSVKSCLTPNDMRVLTSVMKKMIERLRSFGLNQTNQQEDGESARIGERNTKKARRNDAGKTFASSFIRYKKKGSGIATRIRMEVQSFSFVLLREFRAKHGARPLFDFNAESMKGRLEGCMSAMSGECSAILSLNFFNSELADWEYAVEPFHVVLAVEQMPNELILSLATADMININLTGVLLGDVAEMDFDLLRTRRSKSKGEDCDKLLDPCVLTPSAISTLGLRRATELHSVLLMNQTGLDILISPMGAVTMSTPGGKREFDKTQSSCFLVVDGSMVSLDSCFGGEDFQKLSDLISHAFPALALGLAPSAEAKVGRRDAIFDLPVTTSTTRSVVVHKLYPSSPGESRGAPEDKRQVRRNARSSPETILSDTSASVENDYAFYNVDPVVEWCMQNQRLRSSTVDMFSLEKGKDLLSSNVWSPGDEIYIDPEQSSAPLHVKNARGIDEIETRSFGASDHRRTTSASGSRFVKGGNWLRPYLKNDSPEWTDMTCMLRMARERVMLPDNNWIWVNDWTVDLSGSYSEDTDADGWEYEADFETFNRKRRFYRRGDSCRRRRWTRTRMVKPPRLDDPNRLLTLVWETIREENGNFTVKVKSPVILHNCTNMSLSFFVYSYSWEHDILIGTAAPGDSLPVPIPLASATYLRLGMKKSRKSSDVFNESEESKLLADYVATDRLMILPTSYTSSVLLRTSMHLESGVMRYSNPKPSVLHFIVHVKSVGGVTEVDVEPVLRMMNLLPCQLQCQLGEIVLEGDGKEADGRPVIGGGDKRIATMETLVLDTAKDDSSVAVDPRLKPHISFRVPGYRWSHWQRITNRKANSNTWRPTDKEEDFLFEANKDDADHADEYKTIVQFERLAEGGDPLTLVFSVGAGHCPTIRVYAQYWILDKTGFGCRFSDGFSDLLGTTPANETSRRSYILSRESRNSEMQKEMKLPGHQWSIGMNGMSMYFSRKDRISLAIESGVGEDLGSFDIAQMRSKWISPIDVSNVMPKTVFSVDENDGPRRFELALSVTLCPSVFSRTKFITLFPRYQIVNLLDRGLHIAQDGCLNSETFIPSQTSVPFHWEMNSLPPKVKLCAATDSKNSRSDDTPWTNGCIQLDKVGITSMRLPTPDKELAKPMVVQAEVRLATKKQSSAVVVVIWSANENSNPLYLLRNKTSSPILCSQPLCEDASEKVKNVDDFLSFDGCSPGESSRPNRSNQLVRRRRSLVKDRSRGAGKTPRKKRTDVNKSLGTFECGTNIGPIISGFMRTDSSDEYVWTVQPGEIMCFGFEDPEKPHLLEWTCVGKSGLLFQDERRNSAFLEVDAMGSCSLLTLPGGKQIRCQICAEHSTKVIEFVECRGRISQEAVTQSPLIQQLSEKRLQYESMLGVVGKRFDFSVSDDQNIDDDDDDDVAFSLRMDFPAVSISVIDNAEESVSGREILYMQMDSWMIEFSQSREGYHELEFRLMSLQVDNHVHQSVHPVLIFCPRLEENEPFLHMSAVRRLQPHSSTYVFRYAAIRILEVDICLDRRTAETVARFIQPLRKVKEVNSDNPRNWIAGLTAKMSVKYSKPNRRAPRSIEKLIHTANSGRIYFEQLHLHPVRLSLTFTQEWLEWNPATEGLMIFQFIRGMASIANAPLTFTSFVVSHAFESPQALFRIISAHYSSQLTKQIFGILGSLAILGAPADFLANVGTGVRDFFYEPINGLVHGPQQFIEGLEAGTSSLARGVFVGVVRGAANVTEVVNANLVGLTDDDFIDERKAHQRMLADAMSRGTASRTFGDSLYLAGASVARGVKSGAMGIVEQPAIYASKHGPVGFVKGVGKALVGAIVKPVVGVGDAAVLVMNHVSEATSDKTVLLKIPKRLRRALPRISAEQPHCVHLKEYDERAAKAQKIVTGSESVDDVYVGHVDIPSHLVIASDQCLWAIDRQSREPWCVSWEEISHFGMLDGGSMKITVFSQTGLKSHVFKVDTSVEFAELYQLLAMHVGKMGNCSSNVAELDSSMFNGGLDNISKYRIPGIKARQENHVFGSCNKQRRRISSVIKDEIDVVEQCFARVKGLGSELPNFFKILDEEAWTLVDSWGQVFSGLSSRRCIAASIINGTGFDIQIKSSKLVEGGSPCYCIPTKEFDQEQGILHPGGAIIFFGWGVVPSLLQAGRVFMNLETNAFVCDLSDRKSRSTYAIAMAGYQVGFLEKSYDESGWWAKYWLLVRRA